MCNVMLDTATDLSAQLNRYLGWRVQNNLSKCKCLLLFAVNPNLSEIDVSRHAFRKRSQNTSLYQRGCVCVCPSYTLTSKSFLLLGYQRMTPD
jgi:hypothetical protein